MAGFSTVWFGQVISLTGTAMSAFGLTVWAWRITGSATALAMVGFFSFGPTVLLSPIAGALVDRWNRKLVMMLSDLASGLSSVVILILYISGNLQVWHLYVAGAFSGAFQAFQWPAYSAAITNMIPKAQYSRANGMMSLAEWGSGIFAPALAGTLIGLIDISGLLILDIITFVFAICALSLVTVPQPPRSQESQQAEGNLWQESAYGFRFILERPGLLGLQLIFFFGNFLSSIGVTLFNPFILARTNDNALWMGFVGSAASIGGVAGSLLMTIWAGPKRKISIVIFGWIVYGFFAQFVFGMMNNLPLWLVFAFLGSVGGAIINPANQAIWMSKVMPDIQGRVFSIRRLIAQVTGPLAMLITGPLADKVFEPAMREGAPLAQLLGGLFGTGEGSGMGVIISFTGLLILLVGIIAFRIPTIYEVETRLPDHSEEMVKTTDH